MSAETPEHVNDDRPSGRLRGLPRGWLHTVV